jgi:hypothetical protein
MITKPVSAEYGPAMQSPDANRHGALSRMHRPYLLPILIIAIAIIAMLLHGPIAQLSDYHHFADQRQWLGISNAADVLSNLGFAIVGLYGMHLLWLQRDNPVFKAGQSGYGLFFAAVFLTAFGSGWYHLSPDNARLVWDRLPIALGCAGLLAAVWHETIGGNRWITIVLAVTAAMSVAWWRYTDLLGIGDLRPYLLLQLLPLVVIPLLQWQHHRPRVERLAFAAAIGFYVVAKIFELADHAILNTLVILSGHTIKHLLATLAAGAIAWGLSRRLEVAG